MSVFRSYEVVRRIREAWAAGLYPDPDEYLADVAATILDNAGYQVVFESTDPEFVTVTADRPRFEVEDDLARAHEVLTEASDARTDGPLWPRVRVKLTGTDGNAFAVLGSVTRALKAAGVPAEDVARFVDEATRGDYDQLLATCVRWVAVE